ncbi:MAG: DUF4116 domain-containing protein [Pseudomonadota bacterium]|nr:DUF4116 domain-containing protein [Pseudomonadota bacterium]
MKKIESPIAYKLKMPSLSLELKDMPNEVLCIIFRYAITPINLGYLYWYALDKRSLMMQNLLKSNLVWSNPYFWADGIKTTTTMQEGQLHALAKESVRNIRSLISCFPKIKKNFNAEQETFRNKLNYIQLYILAKYCPITALYKLPPKWRQDKQLMLCAIKKNSDCFIDLVKHSPQLRSDKEIIMATVKNKGIKIKHACDALKEDKDVALAAVSNNGLALNHLPESLKSDRDIILAATKSGQFRYIPKSAWSDKEVVLSAVKQDGTALKYASETLQDDNDVVLAAINENGEALEYASKPFQNNKKIVLLALSTAKQRYPSPLLYATYRLRDDMEIVLTAINQNVIALRVATTRLQDDEKVVLLAVKIDGRALKYASKRLQDDKKVVLLAVKTDGRAVEYASKRLQDDFDVVLAAVSQKVAYTMEDAPLKYASKRLQDDFDIVLAAVRHNALAVEYASDRLQVNEEIVLIVRLHEANWAARYLKMNLRRNLRHFPKKYYPVTNLNEFREIALKIVRETPYYFHDLPSYLKKDRYFILDCCESPPFYRWYIQLLRSRREIDDELITWLKHCSYLRKLYKDNLELPEGTHSSIKNR